MHKYAFYGFLLCNISVQFRAHKALGFIFAEMFLSVVAYAIIIEITRVKKKYIIFQRAMNPKMCLIYKKKRPVSYIQGVESIIHELFLSISAIPPDKQKTAAGNERPLIFPAFYRYRVNPG